VSSSLCDWIERRIHGIEFAWYRGRLGMVLKKGGAVRARQERKVKVGSEGEARKKSEGDRLA
jgi:hypothetical protein